jgi:A/G-specific adenine glycosylase
MPSPHKKFPATEGNEDMAPLPEHAPLTEALLNWFRQNKRALPWRDTYAPYHVLVSEFMLQQTQMERAAVYFERWIERFPTLAGVAAADPDEVLKAWEGLGYYSRARNLHKAAKVIMHEHDGCVPDSLEALRALPGVGEYTAGAVLSIAFNRPAIAVDANVERVFARLFDVGAPVKSIVAAGFIRRMAKALIPEGQARDFNQALMELGALVCGKKPRCEACPLSRFCQALHLGITAERPVPGKKTNYSALEIVTGVLVRDGRIFIQKRLESGVWAGFWEFPGGRLEEGETPEQAVVREFAEETEFRVRPTRYLGLVRHAYTRYKIAMHCFVCVLDSDPARTESGRPAAHVPSPDATGFPEPKLHAATEYRWIEAGDIDSFTLPAGHRKLADAWFPELRGSLAK